MRVLFARALSKAGALIILGLAKGIDSAAHLAAIELGPNHFTAAILGTGTDIVYPKQNFGLSQAISRQGLLISEFPLGVGPQPWHFPRRNRIIAALSLGVVVRGSGKIWLPHYSTPSCRPRKGRFRATRTNK